MRIAPLLGLAALAAAPAVAGPAEVDDVRSMERTFHQAFLDADGDAMGRVFADDFVYQHGSGATFDRAAFIDLIASKAVVVTRADDPDMTVRDFGDVIVTYGAGRVDGAVGPDPFATNLRFVNVWRRIDGDWRLAHRNSELLPLED